MQVVRYFHHEDGVEAPSDASVVGQQPRPLGWNLSLPVLEFLTSVRAMLDVDEYDLSGEDEVTGR
jgi:hypothetical protein